MDVASVSTPRLNGAYIRAGLLAGLVAAAVELVPVLSIQGALGVSALRVCQAIASGLTGGAAYSGGVASAALGLVLHVVISLAAGLAFAAASAAWPRLLRHPLLASIAYGAVVYVVMSYVVVPLSAAAFPRAANPGLIAMSLLVHIVAFALPIVFVTRRMLK